jgi:cytochrome bd-type quinol oxidase subunit 2
MNADRRRRALAEGVVFAGAIVMVVALWLPWHHSGRRTRNAFDLILTVERLDVGPTVLDDVWRWLLPLVPVLGALAWIALLARRKRLFVAAVTMVALVVGLPALISLSVDGLQEAGEVIATLGLVGVASGLLASALVSRRWRSLRTGSDD